ncbi:MAG: HAMP domain-containing protein [Planctomycetes bacterium]|nr:HAMP domain-containing protein [Planctomycetota bacterium]
MRLSLRVRVLGTVTAANLLVFGAAFWIASQEIQGRLRAEYEKNLAEASRVLFERLQSTVDQGGGIRVATILSWPLWRYFDDALIVHRNLGADERGRVVPRGAWLNPLGRVGRFGSVDEEAVLADVARAIADGVPRSSQGGTAVPIRDANGAVWGGCWFTLAPYRPPGSPFDVILPAFLLSTALITLATAWILRRSVLDPVARLAAASRRLAAGEMSARAGPGPGAGELGDLIRTFDVMAAEIEGFDARRAREVREATEQVRRAEAAAMTQRRLAATGELAAGIAHEINNPLGGLLNAVDALERDDLAPHKRQQYHGLLRSGLERIRTTVGQLLRFTPRQARPVPLSLSDPVLDAVALVQHRAAALGVEVRFTCAGRAGEAAVQAARALPAVLGEAHELGQAVLNLLVNALDAIETRADGRRGGRVDVQLSATDGELVLSVEDDGPGVAPEDLPRISDLFFTTKDVGKGTGLGLSIVHRIVREHGGALHLASEAGRGLLVEIRLPAWRGVRPEPA